MAERLPDYLVPAAVLTLPALPRTTSGKLDRAALPAPDFAALSTGSRPPATPREETVAGLFGAILGLESVGADDNFFALGGDSILSIQLVSRARSAGLTISVRDVFRYKTVAELAAAARVAEDGPAVEDVGTGDVPATPIVRWLLDGGTPVRGYYQSMVLWTPAGADLDRLTGAVQALLDRHDLLRATLLPGGTLRVPAGAAASVSHVDTTGLHGDALRNLVAEQVAAAAARLDPEAGAMVQAVWFDAGDGRPGQLALVVHHLVIDGVSWRILLDDLRQAWPALQAGRPVSLDPVPTSFRRWAGKLGELAEDPAVTSQLPYWTSVADQPAGPYVLDPARDTLATVRTLTVSLPPEQTRPVLGRLPELFHCGVNDVLLAGLALAVARWRRDLGETPGAAVVTLEGHGREQDLVAGTDLSRTVGWFTSEFPIGLDLTGIDLDDALAGGPSAGEAIRRVKEMLRAVPSAGVGYGLLRHLNAETAGALAALPTPQLAVNYLGRFAAPDGNDPWTPAGTAEVLGAGADPATPAGHPIEVNALTEDGPDGPRLAATWSWPGQLVPEDQVAGLAENWFAALTALAAHAETPGAGGPTPSDFPLVTIAQSDLDALGPDLADVLPLSPLQEGLLFHALFDEGGTDVYVTQLVLELDGPLDPAKVRAAAQALLDRHANLRTSFQHTASGAAIAVIPASAELPWQEIELAGAPDAVLAADRTTPFALDTAPLVRATLIRHEAQRHTFALTHHHILVDGWSTPLMVREFAALYAGQPVPSVPPYRDYLEWLAGRDHEAAREAWRTALTGLDEPTRLVPADSEREPAVPHQLTLPLPPELAAGLVTLGRTHGVTLNTIVQVAWGVLLGRLLGRDDVVFGVTVSGRPAELPGVESMIGLFINTVPARLRLAPAEPVAALLARVQEEQSALLDHQHLGLAEIQRLAGEAAQFDTLTVFENFPRRRGTHRR